MNNKGAIVISLDFELLWGVFDKVDWRDKKVYFQNTRKLIPEILHLFEKYEIHCTWATVGMLFNESWEEWNQNIPEILPEYDDKKLSAYQYGNSIQSRETEEFCFAPDLIKQIKKTPGQEIGTHTYSHYYCLEPGQNPESFKADLEKSREFAEKFGISIKSLVFPRNQFNADYLKICKEIGLQTVRTNPDVWYWKNTQHNSLAQKIFRTGDAYIGWNNKSYKDISEIFPGVTGQKASRLLRSNSGKKIPDKMRIKRIQCEMSAAARNKEVYHLWWHPHNFGTNPENNLRDLVYILEVYKNLSLKYNFSSVTMTELKNETSS